MTINTVTPAKHEASPESIELQAFGGRINQFEDLASASAGILRQQHDGSATLDLRDVTESTVLTGTTSNGQRVNIQVARQAVKYGWGDAQYYMLETDENGDLIIEPGDHHRQLYITMAPGAWTKATIAADYNRKNGTLLTASNITGAWLLGQPFYGSTEAQKVSQEVGVLIYTAHTTLAGLPDKTRSSIHVGLERGYQNYTKSLRFHNFSESPLHPMYVFAFGAGLPPRGFSFSSNRAYYYNDFVFDGVDPSGSEPAMSFENWLVANIQTTHEIGTNAIHRAAGLTLYRTSIHDVVTEVPRASDSGTIPAGETWNAHRNITCGTFIAHVKGVYFLDTYWDHNGWADSYNIGTWTNPTTGKAHNNVGTGLYNNGQYGQPPTIYSHNIYTQYNNADMTWDGQINMRAASIAGQMRIGGWQMRLSSISNQVTAQNIGQAYDEKPGEYSFWGFNYKVAGTHSGNRPYLQAIGGQGAKQWGLDWGNPYICDVDCIIFNRANPDDPADIAAKGAANDGTWAVKYSSRFASLYSNLVDFNWSKASRGTEGLSEAFMRTITIQRYAGEVLDLADATVEGYSKYCENLTPRQLQLEIKAVNRYLLSAREPTLETGLDDRTSPTTCHFKPDWRAEGFRLDNPINLNFLSGGNFIKGDLINMDSINLHGNYAKWVGKSLSLAHLQVREGGVLDVNSGKVSFETVEVGSHVQTSNCGKFYAQAFDGSVVVRGGRFAVHGPSAGSVEASGQGQMILGPDWTVRDGETFRLVGDMGKVGWDSISAGGVTRPDAILTIKAGATLEFEATPVLQFGNQPDTQWGHHMTPWHFHMMEMLGETSGTTGKFDSIRRSMTRQAFVRIRDMQGTPVVGEYTTKPFITFIKGGQIEAILPATIGKIEAGWAGRLGTVNTSATFRVILESGSFLKVKNRDHLEAKTYDLGGGTGTRLTFVDEGATKDAGFSLTGGKLQLSVS